MECMSTSIKSFQAPQYVHPAHVRELELLLHTCTRPLAATTRAMNNSTKAIVVVVMLVAASATSTVHAMHTEQQGHGRVAWELSPRRMLLGGSTRLLMEESSVSGTAKWHEKAFDIVLRLLPGGGRGAEKVKQSNTRD